MAEKEPTSPVTPEELLAHHEWVCGLARALVGDPALADDLAQATYLAAIEKPPPKRVSLRGWLRAVLRNLTRTEARSRVRRSRREAACARPSRVGSTSDMVAKAEAQRRVLEAVLELPEPYRETVMLRYFEELSTPEIAQRLGVPASTVRSRIARGLEKLRHRLEHEATDRADWERGLFLLAAAAPQPAIPQPRFGRPTGVAAVASLAGVVVAVAFWSHTSVDSAAPHAAPRGAESARVPEDASTVAHPRADRPDDTSTRGDAGAEDAHAATVLIVDGTTREPIPGQAVRVYGLEGPLPEWLTMASDPPDTGAVTLRTNAGGAITLPGFVGHVLVWAEHRGQAGRRLVSNVERYVEVELRPVRVLPVEVVDQGGTPVPGVTVQLVSRAPWRTSVLRRAVTGNRGTARLRYFPIREGHLLQLGFATPAFGDLRPVDEGQRAQLTLPPCGHVSVVVSGPDGTPAESGVVHLGSSETRFVPGLWAPIRNGTAEFSPVGLGQELTAEVVIPGRRTTRSVFRGPAEPSESVTHRTVAGTRSSVVSGRMVDAAGRPVFGASLTVSPSGAGRITWCVTDRNGRFCAAVDADIGAFFNIYRSVSAADGCRPDPVARERLATMNQDLGDVTVHFAPLLVAGRVEDSEGKPVAGAVVRVVTARDVPVDLGARTDRHGRFLIRGSGTTGELLVTKPLHRQTEVVSFRCGQTRVRVALTEAGGITGRVHAPRGDHCVRLQSVDTSWRSEVPVANDGSFACMSVPPGRVRVGLADSGMYEVVVAANQVHRVPLLHAGAAGTIRVRVRSGKGKPLPRVRIWSRPVGSASPWVCAVTGSDGCARIPGDTAQEVVAMKGGHRTTELGCASRDVDLVLEPARASKVTLSLGGSDSTGESVSATLVWLGTGDAPDPAHPRNQPFTRIRFKRGVATIRVADPGRYGVQLWRERDEGLRVTLTKVGGKLPRFEVSGRGEDVRLAIPWHGSPGGSGR